MISRRLHRLAVTALVAVVWLPAAASSSGGDVPRLLKAISSSSADGNRAVNLRKARIQIGPATLNIEQGVLVPAASVNGRTLEATFVGEAWFRYAVSDPVESGQLELFTGEVALSTPVSHAVLVTGSQRTLEPFLRNEPADGDPVREAVRFFRTWVEGAERQGFGADMALLKSLAGDPVFHDYAALWCRSPEHGDFYYFVDPADPEQVTLGQFVPVNLSGLDVWQQRSIKNYMKMYNFFGRFADFSIEHPGQWDTWVSTGLTGSDDKPVSAADVPEPEHYTLDLFLNPRIAMDARGTARIRLRGTRSPVHSVSLALYAGLRVNAVFGPDNTPLEFIRRESALHVFLSEPAPPGETFEIRVLYEGDLLNGLYTGETFPLFNTEAWYPRTGKVDRATYEVTLRCPKPFSTLASGQVLERGEEEGEVWERRSLELPALGFTFELGIFEIVHHTVGHVDVTFGFPSYLDKPDRDAVISTTIRCLPDFERKFGPYPLDYLTVVIVGRGFSQGMLSMVTLANAAVRGRAGIRAAHIRKWAEEQRDLTVAHEISHQWWGNWVGWGSYRDQWLSEALATYSALQFGADTSEKRAAFMGRNAVDWRASLTAKTTEGRTIASLGPVTLGHRLNSSKSERAYDAIAYDKGAVVFRMLERKLGEEMFLRILGELARQVANRTLDTPTFLKAVERMSGQDLGLFAEQFIYGTGIPEVSYKYTVAPKENGDGWLIRGEARHVDGNEATLRIEKDAEGVWSVRRRKAPVADLPESTLMVPFQVIITPPGKVKASQPGEIQSARGFGGRLALKGRSTEFSLSVPEKPERLELDQFGEVLALFHDEDWTPRRTRRIQAESLDLSGRRDEARKLLHEALLAPPYSERALSWMSPVQKKGLDGVGDSEDALIHMLLARILIESGEFDSAQKEIEAAEGLLRKSSNVYRMDDALVLRGRLMLARGEVEPAYQHLRVGLQRWRFTGEGFALLAIAAHESGHDRIASQAMERASARGVDVRALREARSVATGGSPQ